MSQATPEGPIGPMGQWAVAWSRRVRGRFPLPEGEEGSPWRTGSEGRKGEGLGPPPRTDSPGPSPQPSPRGRGGSASVRPVLGLFTLSVALLLGLALVPAPVAAAGTEAIDGTVVDGTAGATMPRGLVVTLRGVGQGHQFTVDQSTPVASDGHFSFPSVPADPSVTYVVSTEYAGVPYLTAIPKASGQPTVPVKITVYEPTTSDAAIHVQSQSWLLGSLDVAKQQASVLALLVISNDGDRVYVGDHRGDPGSAVPGVLPRTIRFILPDGASDFQPQMGLDPSKLLPVANGFVDTAPVLPGQHDIAYTFRIGYAETVAELHTTIPYPTAKLRFLAPDAGLEFRTDILADDGTTQIEGHPYRVLGADNVKADSTVTVDVIGLPSVPASRLSPEDMRTGGIALIILAVLVAIVLGVRARLARPADPLAERRALLASIAQLDERYAAGQLGAERYQAERDRQKRQLIDLIVGGRASVSGPGVA